MLLLMQQVWKKRDSFIGSTTGIEFNWNFLTNKSKGKKKKSEGKKNKSERRKDENKRKCLKHDGECIQVEKFGVLEKKNGTWNYNPRTCFLVFLSFFLSLLRSLVRMKENR